MDEEARRLILERARAGRPDAAQRRARRHKASRHRFDGQAPVEDEPTKPVPIAGTGVDTRKAAGAPPQDLAPAAAPKALPHTIAALPAPLVLPDKAPPIDPLRAALEALRHRGLQLPPATTAPQAFWNEGLLALVAWQAETGRSLPGRAERYAGQHLGRWVQVQQERRGDLSPEQVALLQALPDWTWG